MNVLVIDNFDLSTNSVVEVLRKKQCNVTVYRSDASLKVIEGAIKKSKPRLLVIAPGSEDQNITMVKELVRNYHDSISIFGIGLGLHAIVEAFEGRVDRGSAVMHGKTCKVTSDGKTIFKNAPEPFTAGRYNSLVATEVPYNFEVSARDEQGAVMAIRHKENFVEAVQFHPESILTPSGDALFDAVLLEAKR